MQQRHGGSVTVDAHQNRSDDITRVRVPDDLIDFFGSRTGNFLRSLEKKTGTFCFIVDDDNGYDLNLLICGHHHEGRIQAEGLARKYFQALRDQPNAYPDDLVDSIIRDGELDEGGRARGRRRRDRGGRGRSGKGAGGKGKAKGGYREPSTDSYSDSYDSGSDSDTSDVSSESRVGSQTSDLIVPYW